MMKKARYHWVKLAFLLPLLVLLAGRVHAAVGKQAMVVTAHPYATEVALRVLQLGGNAADAAIAAQWVLNVAEPYASGIGGGGFFLFFDAKERRIYALDGREAAPAEAFPEMFLDDQGSPYPFEQRISGGLPVGVPGTLKLLKFAHDKFSSKQMSFSELFQPAIDLAEKGFPISRRFSEFIKSEEHRLKLFEASRKIFFNDKGEPLQPGHILVQKDLAGTFRLIQQQGVRVFYEGVLAEEIVRAIRHAAFHPGFMKKEDFFYYRVIEREPVKGSYRGHDVFSMGLPSSGGATLIEALNILEYFDIRSMRRSPEFIHVFSQAQKLAFQDRNRYLGDPDFSKPPLEKLLSKELAQQYFEMIRMNETPRGLQRQVPLEGTTTSHISIIDSQGNMVAYTTTIEHIFGSAMVVPDRGFFLNNELTDFDDLPKDPQGKLKANAAEGEKRPRSSMTPTFVFKNGLPVLVAGSPGGNTIISAVLNVIVNFIDFQMTLSEALRAPRILNRDGPLELEAELFANASLKEKLRKKGNEIVFKDYFGNVQAIHWDRTNDRIVGESDPRGEGRAAGY